MAIVINDDIRGFDISMDLNGQCARVEVKIRGELYDGTSMEIIDSNQNLISVTLQRRIEMREEEGKVTSLRSAWATTSLSLDRHPCIVSNRWERFPKQMTENLSSPNYIQLEST